TFRIPPLITVPSGGLVQDLTIKMRGTGTISGHAYDVNGEPLIEAHVEAISYYLYAVTNPNMQGLDPGRSYRIPPQWARVPIEVGDKDIDDLRIPIVPTGSIRGRVLIASDAADTEKIDLSKVLVGALSTEITPSPTAILVANVSSTGYFEFPQASEMTLFLHSILLDGWFVSRLQLDG